MLLQKMLEKLSFNIIWAKNGEEAVTTVQKDPSIVLVLMDIRMPKMNGIDATRLIHQEYPQLPVVAVTAFNLSNEKEQCIQAGASGFLTKPINPAKLIQTVQELTMY